MKNHPPTYEIKVQNTDVEGASYESKHFVWDAVTFINSRNFECEKYNREYFTKTNKKGLASCKLMD